ncbi:MAG: 23S rRNA (pseudouridine(1915)-N(3))-methyltransferase RlmH [Acutalibacteraceae bacterium]|nr:23S rRNA (pseudouridine(1915)-N(3))-methyltransferase RlmH [Oscillospiraceae bacterium]
MNITLICVGKLKEKYLADACSEYIKRLSAYKLNVIEVAPERLGDSPTDGEIRAALEKEGRKIIEKLPKSSFVYAMCVEGRQRTSEELSAEIDKIKLGGTGSVTFIIGGSFGLSDEVKQKADEKLSMSRMTFPHQLARVMLLEQIYRAAQISLGTRYHK